VAIPSFPFLKVAFDIEYSNCQKLRMNNYRTVQAPIYNDNHIYLKLSASQDGMYFAFPNQCGTVRLFETRNLKPFADFKMDPLDKSDDNFFIPGAGFCGKKLFVYDKKRIFKLGF